jgi:hypothetical protein
MYVALVCAYDPRMVEFNCGPNSSLMSVLFRYLLPKSAFFPHKQSGWENAFVYAVTTITYFEIFMRSPYVHR